MSGSARRHAAEYIHVKGAVQIKHIPEFAHDSQLQSFNTFSVCQPNYLKARIHSDNNLLPLL